MIHLQNLFVLVRPIFTQGPVDVEDDSSRGCWPESLQYGGSLSYQFYFKHETFMGTKVEENTSKALGTNS